MSDTNADDNENRASTPDHESSDRVTHDVTPTADTTPEGAVEETGDPAVPTELLELHMELEENGTTPEEFKEAFGNEDGSES